MAQNLPKTIVNCIKCQFAAMHAIFDTFKVLKKSETTLPISLLQSFLLKNILNLLNPKLKTLRTFQFKYH